MTLISNTISNKTPMKKTYEVILITEVRMIVEADSVDQAFDVACNDMSNGDYDINESHKTLDAMWELDENGDRKKNCAHN